ncbi:MAG: chemotaxis protein CheC [Peptococcaceae bacterium]
MWFKKGRLTEKQLDVLKETCNIGIGHASTALAKILGKKINMTVPRALFLPLEEALFLGGEPENAVACVNLPIFGEISGLVIFIFDAYSTFRLIDLVMGLSEGSTQILDEMSKSLVKEVGNILAGSFIGAISNFTGLKMRTNVPELAFDMIAATLSSALILHNFAEDQLLVIETVLTESQKEIKGYFFFLTSSEDLEKLFEALS